ncbi:TonB-dependent receptor [Flavihumibacter sp. ZG627]|uniref:SusC/RagA family TonB-linked outer membrane protein n=1 Tax=Flavihumibacter sp. ZG627 TaxID=1463156 RepID=UPI00057E8F1A|nr:TonB-dependent receptor [Flavihumibacter sp. ZG627]KIC89680.1 hypothetical protein HY58_15005 [Flavihumibacter sp. ZG627]
MRKLLCLLLCMVALSGELLAQTKTLTGRVTDDKGSPVPNASVVVKGTSIGTTSGEDGRFSFVVPSNARDIVISAVGFGDIEQRIGTSTEFTISLSTRDKNLAEVVVVGYGTQKKRELTTAVSQVKGSDLQNIPIQGPDQALRGRAAGVNVTQSSGTPGGSININIRGTGSINASSQPLYVIDGIPINIGNYSQIGVGGQTLNALADINPSEIESFEVLKDAAATAIYGSRAANGVVLITTKRGANRKTRVNINSYYGISEVYKQLPVLTGPQFVQLNQEMIRNRFGATVTPGQLGLAGLDGDPSSYPTTNWQDEIFRGGAIQSYDLNLQGGNENTKFFISGAYFSQEGIVIGSGFKRYNLRMNIDNNLSKKIKVGTSIGLSRSKNTRIQNDNNIYGVVSTALLYGSHFPAYKADGTYGRDPNASIENAIANAVEPTYDVNNNRILANAYGEWQITNSLSFRSVVGADYLNFREQQYIPSTHIQGAGVRGDGREGYSEDLNLTNENILTFKKQFGDDHDLTLTGVASFQESRFESIFAQATNFPGDAIRRLTAGSQRVAATSNGSSYGIVGYLARAIYGFQGKYLVTASIRRDGVSRFGADKRWGTFPAASVAWRISEEGFLKNSNVISDLKLRASWGEAGNSSIGDFASLPLVGAGNNYAQAAGLAPSQLGNPNLGWESSEQTNVGIDVGFLNNRINLTADYYIRNTRELLLARPLVGSSGFTTINENIGSLQNKGFEFALNSTNIDSRDFRWTTNFNITFPDNKVVKLAGTPFASGFASWVEEGQDLGSFRGFVVKGIFQSQEEIAAAPVHSAATRPGDIEFADLDGDNRITTADQKIIGSAVPDFFGGMINELSYKGIGLNFFLQFVSGNEIYNNTRAFGEGMNSIFGQLATVENRWTADKGESATLPRAVFGDPSNNRRTSTRWLEDGSFMRLKNVQLFYNLPQEISKRIKMNNIRIFIQGENLKTWTDYQGFDPEVSTFSITNTAPGTDFLTYPQAKTITFGVNLSF